MLSLGVWMARLWWWNTFSGGRSAHFVSITALRKAHPDWFVADLGTLLGLLKRGDINPRVAQRIDLGAVADAHARLERGTLEGKIVLLPNGAISTGE
jgi:NADPH:quinone reductase-like Zn-dependent oxidoreductase